jgi:hypothetical protein
MTRRKIPKLRPGELSQDELIILAIEDYNIELTLKRRLSIRQYIKRRGILYETLRDRILYGAKSRKNFTEARQRLTVAEEEVLEEYCL